MKFSKIENPSEINTLKSGCYAFYLSSSCKSLMTRKIGGRPSETYSKNNIQRQLMIFILSRPFGKIRGTGFERYSSSLYYGLKKANLNVIHVSEITFIGKLGNHSIKAYHSLLGLILFDIFIYIEYLIRIKTSRQLASRNYIIHITEPLQGIFTPIFSRFLTKNIVITIHDIAPLYQTKSASLMDRLWNIAFVFSLRVSLSNASQLIAVSTQTRNDIMNQFGIPSEKITTIFSGIDEKFRPSVDLSKKFHRELRIVGCVGSLIPRKRFDKAIRMFDILRRIYKGSLKLVICGEGPLKQSLESLISELGLSDMVELLSHVPEEEMVDLYNNIDVLMYTSEYEGFGYPILEAQLCGVPVIVYRDSKIPEEVKRCCIEVEDDYHAAEVINKLLTQSTYYENVSKESINYASNFRWDKIIDEVIKDIKDLNAHADFK